MSRRSRLAQPRNLDPAASAKLEEDLRLEREATRRADLKWVMSDERGRRVFFELLFDPSTGCGFDEASPATNGSQQFIDVGKRLVAKTWIDRLKREIPSMYLAMQDEQLEAEREANLLRERDPDDDQGD